MSQHQNFDTTFTKIYVGGLPWTTRKEGLRNYFEQFGEIIHVNVVCDRATDRSQGYGFVTFKDAESATRACMDANPSIDGRITNCKLASSGANVNHNQSNLMHGANVNHNQSNLIHGANVNHNQSNLIHGANVNHNQSNLIHGAYVNHNQSNPIRHDDLCFQAPRFWQNQQPPPYLHQPLPMYTGPYWNHPYPQHYWVHSLHYYPQYNQQYGPEFYQHNPMVHTNPVTGSNQSTNAADRESSSLPNTATLTELPSSPRASSPTMTNTTTDSTSDGNEQS